MVWWVGCLWLVDRGPKETKLPLWKEVMEGLEIKLKNVPQTLLSFLMKLFHWQRLQKHTELVESHHPLIFITFNAICHLTTTTSPISLSTLHSRRFRRGGGEAIPKPYFPTWLWMSIPWHFPTQVPHLKPGVNQTIAEFKCVIIYSVLKVMFHTY